MFLAGKYRRRYFTDVCGPLVNKCTVVRMMCAEKRVIIGVKAGADFLCVIHCSSHRTHQKRMRFLNTDDKGRRRLCAGSRRQKISVMRINIPVCMHILVVADWKELYALACCRLSQDWGHFRVRPGAPPHPAVIVWQLYQKRGACFAPLSKRCHHCLAANVLAALGNSFYTRR